MIVLFGVELCIFYDIIKVMKNFQPGGLRNRKPDLGGRPFSDAGNYAPKKRFEGGKASFGSKPAFGGKPSFGNDRDKKDVTLYAATCTTCGKSCEVPFRPDGKKPVLCRDCFAAKNESPTNSSGFGARDKFTPNEMAGRISDRTFTPKAQIANVHPVEFAVISKQLASLEAQVKQILEHISHHTIHAAAHSDTIPTKKSSPEAAATVVPTKVRKPKKVTPAIKKAAVKKKVAKKAAVAKKVAKKAAK